MKKKEGEVEGEDEEGADGSVFFAAKWQRARANRVGTSAAISQEYKRTTDSQATGPSSNNQSVSFNRVSSFLPSFCSSVSFFLSFFFFFFFPPTTYLPRHHASNLLPLSHFASSPRRVVTVAVDCSVFTDAARLRDVEWSA